MTFIWVTGWTLGAEALQWKPEKCPCGVQFHQVLASGNRLVTERNASLPLRKTKLELRDQPGNGQREPDEGSNMEQEGKQKPEKIVRLRKRTLPNWEGPPMWEGARVGLTNQPGESEGRLGEGYNEPIKSKEIVRKRKRKPEKVVRLRKRTLPDPQRCDEVLGFEPDEIRSISEDEHGEDRSNLVESNSTVQKPEAEARESGPARKEFFAVSGSGKRCGWLGSSLSGKGSIARGTRRRDVERGREAQTVSILVNIGIGQKITPKEGLLVASRAEMSPKAVSSHEKETPRFLIIFEDRLVLCQRVGKGASQKRVTYWVNSNPRPHAVLPDAEALCVGQEKLVNFVGALLC
jgi:hypothetical protein